MCRDITYWAAQLDCLHTLRLLNIPLFNMLPIIKNQDYYYSIYRLVCGVVRPNDDPMLLESYAAFLVEVGDNMAALSNRGISNHLSSLAVQRVQNNNEHIARNFKPVFCRLLRLRMIRNPHFSATKDLWASWKITYSKS